MKNNEINIRDPFVLVEGDTYYMYGTRAANFGYNTGGFDVYISKDLTNWSEPHACFDSEAHGLNRKVNWAPEVHKYRGAYYMFATFTKENGLRGTFSLKADSPLGPFLPHSEGALTPYEWECLDGTLYIDRDGKPYLVFCHEHTQIIDGTICYVALSEDLKRAAGEVTTLFCASSPAWADDLPKDVHRVTDGPFMYRSKTGELFMLWSTFIKEQYAECLVKFPTGELCEEFVHLDPLITDDGGHGMIFSGANGLFLTYHTPNTKNYEHPFFRPLTDHGDHLTLT